VANTINILVTLKSENDSRDILTVLSEQNDFRIIGTENEEAQTIIKSHLLQPDILILDSQLPGLTEYNLARIIRSRSPSTRIILLCDKDEENAYLAYKTGISGILNKKTDMGILVPVIRIISEGKNYYNIPHAFTVNTPVKHVTFFPEHKIKQNHIILSPAERGIVTDIVQGLSDKQIAEHLHFSAGTIRNYVTAIKRKTKLTSRTQLAVYSLVNELVHMEQLELFKGLGQPEPASCE